MEETIVYQGEDVDIEIEMIRDDGTPLNMDGAGDVVLVVHDGYGNPIVKYTQNTPSSGWEQLEPGDPENGIISALMRSEHTETLNEGKYYAEVRVRYYSSASDDGFYDVTESMELFVIRKSVIVAEALL